MDFDEQYRCMTEDELLNLARDSQHLTPEARSSLNGELSRRRIASGEVTKYAGEQTDGAIRKRFNPKSAILKPLALVIGVLFSLVGTACVMLVTVAVISSGMWGLGHTAPVLLIGIPALALGIVCFFWGSKRSPTSPDVISQ